MADLTKLIVEVETPDVRPGDIRFLCAAAELFIATEPEMAKQALDLAARIARMRLTARLAQGEEL